MKKKSISRWVNIMCGSLHNLTIFLSPLTSFQALVSTICSNTDILADVFLGVKFCSSHILHFLSCFLYISLWISFFLFCSILFSTLLFLKHFFTCFHIGLNSLSNIFPSNFISSPSNCIVLPFVCIVNIISSLTELHSFLTSCFQASLIHLYLTQTYDTLHVTLFLHNFLSVSPLPPSFLFMYNCSSIVCCPSVLFFLKSLLMTWSNSVSSD